MAKFKNIETKLIVTGEPDPRIGGAVAMPIFQTAMYETFGDVDYHDIKYIRLNNTPNHAVLHEKLADLENAQAALVTASGMAAISTSLLTVLSTGDHLLIQNTLYGGTHDFAKTDLPSLGIEFDFIDPANAGSWESKLKPNTKAIYVESISNPLMLVGDLEAVVDFGKAHNLVTMIDNTFTSPVNFRPIEIGFDLSFHSCTKYLNGHSDIVAGAVIGNAELVDKIKHRLDHFGGSLDPHACFLLHRGLKTLALRVKHQNKSALEIAKYLEAHPNISNVNYPGLEKHPSYRYASTLFDGYGGMLSFELEGGRHAVDKLMRLVTIPVIAPSLGGVETLLTVPATTSHAGLSTDELAASGISETLVRMSVGIEATEDIIADMDQALAG